MIKGLNGIRGLAVLFVIFSHVEFWKRIGFSNEFTIIMMRGDFGVRLFFVLSGFLITHLIFKEVEDKGAINLKNFWIRRLLRLMPLYFLVIFLTLFIDVSGGIEVSSCAYGYAFLYAYNFVSSTDCTSWQGFSHFWSLAVEEHFYLIWPLVIYCGLRFGLVFIFILVVSALAFKDLSFFWGSVAGMNRWTFPAMVPIAIGCLGGYLIRGDYFKRLLVLSESSGIFLVFAVSLIFLPYLGGGVDSRYILQSFGIVFVLCYIYFNQSSRLVDVLEWQPLVSLGLISYGLYIWQGFFTGNGSYRQHSAWPPSVDLGVFFTFLVAPISYWYFERPLLKIKDRFR